MPTLSFSVEEFFAVFAAYNETVWPMQWILEAAGFAVLVLLASGHADRNRWVGVLLGLLWAWAAVAYHLWHFARINPLAFLFAAAFLSEAGLLLWLVVRRQAVTFAFRLDLRGWLAAILVLYALVVYPAIGSALGHRFPATPTFGVPCPTTIFTIGLLWTATAPLPRSVVLAPLLWCAIGGQ
ncbi:MAG: hypothetical protein JXB36_21100, partial [Gammaproteobacteria bacterium]|nr:hypothetical protein [Gammaproteobacteria bacterium]